MKTRKDRKLSDEQLAVVQAHFRNRRSIPSDAVLAKLYGVSVATIRKHGARYKFADSP